MAKRRTATATSLLVLVALGGAACSGGPSSSTSAPAARGAAARAYAAAGTTVEWPVTRCGTYSGEGCAPTSRRVDLTRPTFSNPTAITNPLFPIGDLHSAVLLGTVDGKPFRAETTLLPGTGTVTVDGKQIKVLVSQYTAYLDGRIDEVALDRYAQADDGSVWYLGEDVYDYRDGLATITEGTWLAGREGPPAMIMPSRPKVGDVFRAENVPAVIFEEITVKALGRRMAGPRGPVGGAVVMQELHLDGSTSDKVFVPGYGEFFTSADGEVEALALAVPTDAVDRPVSSGLRLMTTSALGILENARLQDWEAAAPTLARMKEPWAQLRTSGYPPLVVHTLDKGVARLGRAVAAEEVRATSQAAVELAQSALDLELLHRGNVEVDRFHLHAQQLRIHAAAKDAAGVAAEVATLEWIRDRLAGLPEATLADLDADLRALRVASDAGNLQAAGDHAARTAALVRGEGSG